jgi:hypothetical protein
LITDGKALEEDLDLQHGQFKGRSQAAFSFMTKPFAAALIYPAVLAAWTYLVCFPEDSRRGNDISLWAFISGFVWIVIYDVYLKYGLYIKLEDFRRPLKQWPVWKLRRRSSASGTGRGR